MRQIPLYLIPPLAIAAIWIQSANQKALHDLPKPLFAAIDSLQLEKFALQQDLFARQQEIAALKAHIATQTANVQTQTQPMPTGAHRSPVDDSARTAPDGARAQLIAMHNADLQSADLTQLSTHAPTIQFAATATAADDYWQQIQAIANQNILSRADKTAFLNEGSALIHALQEAQQHLLIDLESVQFLEVKAHDQGIDGQIALNDAKKNMAAQMSLIARYHRDIATLINPHTTVSTPRMPGTLTPNIGQPAVRYSHLSMESEIVITQNRAFLVTLHFFYTDNQSDPPQLVSVTDIFNLNTMQSAGKKFFYPDYFLKDIYELVRKTWRGQGVKWNRKPTIEDLQVFLTVIN